MDNDDPDLKPGLLVCLDETRPDVAHFLAKEPKFSQQVAEVVAIKWAGSIQVWWPALHVDWLFTLPEHFKKIK